MQFCAAAVSLLRASPCHGRAESSALERTSIHSHIVRMDFVVRANAHAGIAGGRYVYTWGKHYAAVRVTLKARLFATKLQLGNHIGLSHQVPSHQYSGSSGEQAQARCACPRSFYNSRHKCGLGSVQACKWSHGSAQRTRKATAGGTVVANAHDGTPAEQRDRLRPRLRLQAA